MEQKNTALEIKKSLQVLQIWFCIKWKEHVFKNGEFTCFVNLSFGEKEAFCNCEHVVSMKERKKGVNDPEKNHVSMQHCISNAMREENL